MSCSTPHTQNLPLDELYEDLQNMLGNRFLNSFKMSFSNKEYFFRNQQEMDISVLYLDIYEKTIFKVILQKIFGIQLTQLDSDINLFMKPTSP